MPRGLAAQSHTIDEPQASAFELPGKFSLAAALHNTAHTGMDHPRRAAAPTTPSFAPH